MLRICLQEIRSKLSSAAIPESSHPVLRDPCSGCLDLNIANGLRPKDKYVTSYELISNGSNSGCLSCKLLRVVLQAHYPRIEDQACHDVEPLPSKTGSRSPLKIIWLHDDAGFGLDIFVAHEHQDDESCVCRSPWPSLCYPKTDFGNTGREAALQQIRNWLLWCSIESEHLVSRLSLNRRYPHESCQPSLQERSFPTRILRIRGARDLALHITQEALFAEYACPSYCWGGEVSVRLTTALLDKFQHGMEWELLPLTFQYAIELWHGLEMEYLWIDALCIIQDDQPDWHREAGRMASTYSQASITLAASKSRDANEGLYSPALPMESFGEVDSSTRPLMQYKWSYGRMEPLRTFNLMTYDGHLH